MKLLKYILWCALILLFAEGCFLKDQGTTLPKASPGNADAGSVAEDEPSLTNQAYIQAESRTPIEYLGTSN